MEKITLDTGLKSYRINGGGVLKFNPTDPNLYIRFQEAVDKIKQLEQELAQAQGDPLENLGRADQQIKKTLNWVFGGDNDFDLLLGCVNVLAVASNGERVVTNLLEALLPVLTQGARLCAGTQAKAARDKAEARRKAQC